MASPMMQQYQAAKREHPEGILFFRMGDFFEMFYEDAELMGELLGLTVTSRSKGDTAIPMAGVPVRSVDGYINRLIQLGRKVVLCDQVQDASEAKGLVERAITRVVTPGTRLVDEGLEDGEDNFLCGLLLRGDRVGLALVDVSTGRFEVCERPAPEALDLVSRFDPAELLVPEVAGDEAEYATLLKAVEITRSTLPDWRFDEDEARRLLCEHFNVARLEGYGIADLPLGIGAAGAVLHYVRETQRASLRHLSGIRHLRPDEGLILDRTTRLSLEITQTAREGNRKGSLLWVMDRSLTPMGARRLRSWLLRPLTDVAAIRARQETIGELVEGSGPRAGLRALLKPVQDIERLLSRVSCGRCSARELVGLRESLKILPPLREALAEAWSPWLVELRDGLPRLDDLVELLERALLDEVPVTVKEGGLIRDGFDAELDELRSLGKEGKDWIAAFQAREQEAIQVPIKVGFNRVFGYYIEITRTNADRVPEHYIRRQTLKNSERFVVPELKEYEEKVLGAEEKIYEREYQHFLSLRTAVEERLHEIQKVADAIARLDSIQSLAEVAAERRFCRPEVDDSEELWIKQGRHPVLDQTLVDEPFVPNDCDLRGEGRRIGLITGPNMAGKSTYIRQTALITLLAQVGSFVPAEEARVGVVDRIFTRIGASDELARGNSTFMVEMMETADILNNATSRSLVILDEVGRGTSTFDGLSIAWGIMEHLAQRIRCRGLFATHYHQLVDLARELPTSFNLCVAVREWEDQVIFLHRIVEGGTDRSYGIHVARLAGLPPVVLQRAEEVLEGLEADPLAIAPEVPKSSERQLDLFAQVEDALRTRLDEIDPDRLTPLEALQLLGELKKLS